MHKTKAGQFLVHNQLRDRIYTYALKRLNLTISVACGLMRCMKSISGRDLEVCSLFFQVLTLAKAEERGYLHRRKWLSGVDNTLPTNNNKWMSFCFFFF